MFAFLLNEKQKGLRDEVRDFDKSVHAPLSSAMRCPFPQRKRSRSKSCAIHSEMEWRARSVDTDDMIHAPCRWLCRARQAGEERIRFASN